MNKSFELHEIPKACYLSQLDSLLKSLRQEDPLSPFLLRSTELVDSTTEGGLREGADSLSPMFFMLMIY